MENLEDLIRPCVSMLILCRTAEGVSSDLNEIVKEIGDMSLSFVGNRKICNDENAILILKETIRKCAASLGMEAK